MLREGGLAYRVYRSLLSRLGTVYRELHRVSPGGRNAGQHRPVLGQNFTNVRNLGLDVCTIGQTDAEFGGLGRGWPERAGLEGGGGQHGS